MKTNLDRLSAVYKHLESIGSLCPEQATRLVHFFEPVILSKIHEKIDPRSIAAEILFLWSYSIMEKAGKIYQGQLLLEASASGNQILETRG